MAGMGRWVRTRWVRVRMAGYLGLAMVAGYYAAVQFSAPSDVLREQASAPSGITASTASTETHAIYQTCSDARAAGVAPMYRGEPGYSAQLDVNNDGVACEPYYGPVKNFGRKTHERHKSRYAASP